MPVATQPSALGDGQQTFRVTVQPFARTLDDVRHQDLGIEPR